VLHEPLHKKKPFLDSLGDGLQVLGVRDMICHFPSVFLKAFVYSGKVTSAEVLKILKPIPHESEMDENNKRVWKYVTGYIEDANSQGNVNFVRTFQCL